MYLIISHFLHITDVTYGIFIYLHLESFGYIWQFAEINRVEYAIDGACGYLHDGWFYIFPSFGAGARYQQSLPVQVSPTEIEMVSSHPGLQG